jgi:hypothetical protein
MRAARILLASLTRPPNTSLLPRCDDRQTRSAINSLIARFAGQRAALEDRRIRGPVLDKILGSLQRLRSPNICAYYVANAVLVSEEFDAVPRAGCAAAFSVAQMLVAKLLQRTPPSSLTAALAPFGERAIALAADAGVRIVIVPGGRAFTQCSPAVAALVPDIDSWQAPPAGLFVLEERLILLRAGALRMAVAHEFAHALDALAAAKPRSYFSFENSEIRAAYSSANGFINEYAASSLDEYFAESMRAYVEVNDNRSSWLPLTRKMLQIRDARMFSIIEEFIKAKF